MDRISDQLASLQVLRRAPRLSRLETLSMNYVVLASVLLLTSYTSLNVIMIGGSYGVTFAAETAYNCVPTIIPGHLLHHG